MNTQSPHGQSARLCLSHMPALLMNMILQLALRLIAFSPLIAVYSGVSFGLDKRWAPAIGLLASLLLHIVIAMPFRFYSRGALMLAVRGAEGQPPVRYGAWLRFTLARVVRFLPWGLCLIVYLAGFYYLWNIAPATQFPRLVSGAGKLVGGRLVHGFAVWAAVLLLALLPAIIGWRRYLAAEFIAVSTDGALFPASIRAAKGRRRALAGATAKNLIVVLPAVVAVLFVLGMDLAPRFKGSLSSDLFLVLTAVSKMDFSTNALLTSALMLTLLYLPFVFFRKGALAVVLAESRLDG